MTKILLKIKSQTCLSFLIIVNKVYTAVFNIKFYIEFILSVTFVKNLFTFLAATCN